MAIKLIALDIDGTLLDSEGNLPPADAEAIAAAKAREVMVTLVTARQRLMAAPVAEALHLSGPLVLHNGAIVWLPQEDRELLRLTIDLEHARAIAAFQISAHRAPMHKVLENGDTIGDRLMRTLAVDVHNESHAATVVLESGIV